MEITYEGILDAIDKMFNIIKAIINNILDIVKSFGSAVETPAEGE